MREKFGKILDELNESLLEMGKLVTDQFEKSKNVLRSKDTELAKMIIEDDDKINEEAIKYQIKVSMKKTSKIDVELYSSEKNYELLDGKKKIKDLRLEKDKKEKIVYALKLVQRKIPSKDEYVNVKITEDK